MPCDQRYSDIKRRLEQLPIEALARFIIWDGNVCYDTYNYDKERDAYCPMAIILDVPRLVVGSNNTDRQTIRLMNDVCKYHNYEFGTVKDVPGDFYRDDREGDFKRVFKEVFGAKLQVY